LLQFETMPVDPSSHLGPVVQPGMVQVLHALLLGSTTTWINVTVTLAN
jgi:hypothetical protein